VAGSVLTFAYTARLLLGAFRPGVPTEGRVIEGPPPTEAPPAPAVSFWLPAAHRHGDWDRENVVVDHLADDDQL